MAEGKKRRVEKWEGGGPVELCACSRLEWKGDAGNQNPENSKGWRRSDAWRQAWLGCCLCGI